MTDLFEHRARARTADPATSHDAARAVDPNIATIRTAVDRWASGRGPDGFIDEELSAAFDAADSSSYRTRRGELTREKRILDSGRRRRNENMRECIVWVHRDHFGQYAPAEQPLTYRDKLDRHANRLCLQAKQMKAEGRTAFAAELEETAELIREGLKKAKAKDRPQAGQGDEKNPRWWVD